MAESNIAIFPREKAPRRAAIELIAFNDMKLRTTRRYLVKGLIPRVGVTLVWGKPKVGKSFWIFDLAMHIALGREYRGRRVQQGAVVYAMFEGQFGAEARKEAWADAFLEDASDPVPFYFQLLQLDLIKDHEALIDAIRERLGDDVPAAVILDTLNKSLVGSENSDEDMAAYLRAADSIREAFECSVIVVHHCGHDGARPRGHSSLGGGIDAQIKVYKDENGNIVSEVEMAKDGPDGEQVVSRLEVVTVGEDDDGEVITSCIIRPVDDDDFAPPAPRSAGGSKPASKTKLTSAGRVALIALQEAIDAVGVAPPEGLVTGNLVPKVATVQQWREAAYQRHISASDEDRAKQQAFQRAMTALQADNRVVVSEPYAWPIYGGG